MNRRERRGNFNSGLIRDDFRRLNSYIAAIVRNTNTKYLDVSIKLSIVVLNYQGSHIVCDCLRSIFNSSYPEYELIFVDNNSDDGSYEESLKLIGQRENVKIIRNERNLGFTLGFDIGINNSVGEYVLLLNNDTIVYQDALTELVKFMDENPSVGLAEGRIENVSGDKHTFSDPRIATFCGLLVEAGEHVDNPEIFSKIERIFSPVGVWPIIRKEIYNKVGGYDQDYVHFEEIRDLAARIWIFGYEVGYIFRALTQHVGRLTDVNKNYGTDLSFQLYYHASKNQLMFFFKNYSTRTLLKYYFPYLGIKSADLFYTLFRFGKKAFFTKVRAYKWFFMNLPRIIEKRKFINKNRVVKDKVIQGNLVRTNMNELRRLISFRRKYDKKTVKWISNPTNPSQTHEEHALSCVILVNRESMSVVGGGDVHIYTLSRIYREVYGINILVDSVPFKFKQFNVFSNVIASFHSLFLPPEGKYCKAPQETIVIAPNPYPLYVIRSLKISKCIGGYPVLYFHHLSLSFKFWLRRGFVRTTVNCLLHLSTLALCKILDIPIFLDNAKQYHLRGINAYEDDDAPDPEIASASLIPAIEKKYDLCYVGRFQKHKGALDLIRVVRHLKSENISVKVAIVGNVDESFKRKALNLIKRSKIDGNFFFLGVLGNQEKLTVLSSSKIYAHFSYEEGWSLSVMDAASIGIPVVAYDLPAYSYLNGSYKSVPLGNVKEATLAVKSLLFNYSEALIVAEKAKKAVSKYNYKDIAKYQIKSYQEILNKHRKD